MSSLEGIADPLPAPNGLAAGILEQSVGHPIVDDDDPVGGANAGNTSNTSGTAALGAARQHSESNANHFKLRAFSWWGRYLAWPGHRIRPPASTRTLSIITNPV